MVFVVTTRRAPVNSIGSLVRWSSSRKRRVLPIIDESGTLLFCACGGYVELTKNTLSRSQLSYRLEKKIIVMWFTLNGKKTRNTRKKLSRTYHLIMFISSYCFILSLPWKFCRQLVGKDTWLAFVVDLWLYLNKREHKQPEIRAPHQLYLVNEVCRVRNKSSLTFFEWKGF